MRKSAVLVIFLMLASGFAITANATVEYDTGLAAILQVDTTQVYTLGDDVRIWALVYDDGAAFDPYDLRLSVGWDPSREVPTVRRDTGVYEATVTISPADVTYYYDLHVTVWVYRDSLHTSWVTDSTFVPVKHMEVEISVDETADEVPSPGEDVNFTVRTTYDGALVDPDAGTLEVERRLTTSTLWIAVPVTRVGTGLHRGSMTLPPIKGSYTFNLAARGEYTSPDGKVLGYSSTSFEVYSLPVWMHTVSVTRTGAVVDVHVHELDGVPYPTSIEGYPLEGAQVRLHYEYRSDQYVYEEDNATGTTNESGVARLSLSWPDLYKYDLSVPIDGTVMAPNFYRQDIDGRIIVRDDVDVQDEDFFAVELVSEYPIPITEPLIEMRFQARNNGVALSSHDIMVYIYDENAIYYRRTVTTDTRGYFEVSIKPPAQLDPGRPYATPWFYFNTDLGGYKRTDGAGYWVGDGSLSGHVGLLFDENTTIKVSTVKENNEVTVLLDHPDADGTDERAIIGWGVGDPAEMDLNWAFHREGTWYPLHQWLGGTDSRYLNVNYESCEWTDGAYHGSFHYPGYLPDDMNVYVYGVITFRKDTGDEKVAAMVKDLVPQEGKGWPTLHLTGPAPAGWYEGDVNITGTAHDEDGVTAVEVRVDSGQWMTATGTDEWYMVLDTTELAYGVHYIDLRAFNGEKYSKVFPFAINTDQRPTVTVVNPEDGGRYRGNLTISGTASDDMAVDGVQLQIDGGPWVDATGTDEWSYEQDLSSMTSGDHTLAVKALGGTKESFAARLVFVVDRLPEVKITDPPSGAQVSGTFHIKGEAQDDLSLEEVQLRIDEGEWFTVSDASPWSYELDTTTLAYGEHHVDAQAWDGYEYSDWAYVEFTVDNPPSIVSVDLADGQSISGVFRIEGEAQDDDEVEAVQVQVDGGDWIDAEGAEEWYYDLDTAGLSHGSHTLRVRSYDGTSYSDEVVITFDVNEPPILGEVSLEAGDVLNGTATITGGSSDDVGVEGVQVRIDGGDWVDVEVDEEGNWSYDLDTSGLSHGSHTLEVRVSDGDQWSEPTSVEFEVDQRPTVAIVTPEAGVKYKKDFEFNGTASDDAGVTRVEFRLDGGEWQVADGTLSWSHAVKLKDVKKGEHTVDARSWDGTQHSDVESVTFKVEKKEEDSPGFGALMAGIAVLVPAVAIARRRR